MDDLRFTSFSVVFPPYQDDGRVIMKGCVQRLKRFPPSVAVRNSISEPLQISGPTLNPLSYRDTQYWKNISK